MQCRACSNQWEHREHQARTEEELVKILRCPKCHSDNLIRDYNHNRVVARAWDPEKEFENLDDKPMKFKTEGKPQTHDLNQGEFLDEDMSVVFDIKGFAKENAEAPESDPEAQPPDTAVETVAGQTAEGDVTAETQPGDAPVKRGRGRPKKNP